MIRVAILISGGGSNMVELCQSMLSEAYAHPIMVLSNDPNAAGLDRAHELGIATASVDHKPFGRDRASFEAKLLQQLDVVQPDILCLAGFMRVLTADFVSRFEDRILNIHPSLLPKYPGLNTHERAIEAGDSEAGCTVHLVTPVLDDGPILGQARVPIMPEDTPNQLAKRVLVKEHQLYPAVLKRFCAGDRSILNIS